MIEYIHADRQVRHQGIAVTPRFYPDRYKRIVPWDRTNPAHWKARFSGDSWVSYE